MKLLKSKTIIRRLKAIRGQEISSKINYDQECKDFVEKRYALQKRCSHPDTYFHIDPVGGSNSFIECTICGKHLRRSSWNSLELRSNTST